MWTEAWLGYAWAIIPSPDGRPTFKVRICAALRRSSSEARKKLGLLEIAVVFEHLDHVTSLSISANYGIG
jgi:hypothetical protein